MQKDNGLINFYKQSEDMFKERGLLCECNCGKPKFPQISNYPIVQISQSQLDNAKLLQNKYSIFNILNKKNMPINFMEIGVMAGDFSYEACKQLKINNMYLIDPFNNDDHMATGMPERFSSKDNYKFVKDRFAEYHFVKFFKGMSNEILPKYFSKIDEKNKLDFIYIDSNHEFNNTYYEITYASKILADDGIIGIDDYISSFNNPIDFCEVMQAVNYFLQQNKNWNVSYYSIHENGLHNIYLSKNIN